jgi:hypothetical protein
MYWVPEQMMDWYRAFCLHQNEAVMHWVPEQMMEWQPIESAPKDGTKILAYGGTQDSAENDDGEAVDYAVIFWAGFTACPYQTGWRFCNYDSGYYGEWCNPTHWMPLPEKPK